MDDFKDQVKKGFNKCRLDIETIKNENSELYSSVTDLKIDNSRIKNDILELKNENAQLTQSNNSLKNTVQTLSKEISELKGEIKGINIALDYIKNFKEQQISTTTTSQTNQQIPTTTNITQKQQNQTNLEPIKSPTPNQEIPHNNITIMSEKPQEKPKNQDPYEALLAFKAKINKKEILKQKLLSMVNEMGINLSELKFLFVDHYKYCSKATFYNYLKEIELEKLILIKRENTKNFVYLNRETISDEI